LAGIIPPQADENVPLAKRVNIEGSRNLIETLEEHNPKAFLLFSSSISVYGDRLKNPEIYTTDALATEQHDEYGKAKIETEKLIQQSSLDWSILRLTAIMGIGNHKVSGIMFHVPLATPMEIASVKDTATAFAHAIDKKAQLNKRIFNLSGGKQCRISYFDFMTRAFNAFGMGKVNFPEKAFASQNFHCGHYMDGDQLEDILHFRSDTIDSYFDRFRKSVNPLQRISTRPFAWFVKKYLLTLSEPYRAIKKNNSSEIHRFFGDSESTDAINL
jgi:nucleoside-diphosphate-sugar epimerase